MNVELRSIVRLLRDGGDADLAPQRSIADITALGQTALGQTSLGQGDGSVPVRVTVSGDLEELPPGVGAALYRIAQESVTNARQHSEGATCVQVAVSGSPTSIHLEVTDDGAPVGARRRAAGPRAHVLGAQCS